MTIDEIKNLIIKYKDEINLGLKYFFNDTLRNGALPLDKAERDILAIVLMYGVSDIYKFHIEDTIKDGRTLYWVIRAEGDNDFLWWSMSSMEYHNAWMNLPKKIYNWLGSLRAIQVR